MRNNILFISAGVILLLIVFTSGCTEAEDIKEKIYTKQEAEIACKEACINALAKDIDLSNGPCIAEEIVDDWACDIAHNPRNPVTDNMVENQCRSFMEQKVHNFIELDEECNLIQFYEKK